MFVTLLEPDGGEIMIRVERIEEFHDIGKTGLSVVETNGWTHYVQHTASEIRRLIAEANGSRETT